MDSIRSVTECAPARTPISEKNFDYAHAVSKVCQRIIRSIPNLKHINIKQVGISIAPEKNSLLAACVPMRDGGLLNQQIEVPELCPKYADLLYIIYFYAPQFINLNYKNKMETIVHELYHISPMFDGTLRRFPGRYSTHGFPARKYDQTVREMTKPLLEQPLCCAEFLKLNALNLTRKYGKVSYSLIHYPYILPCTQAAKGTRRLR
jgi:predicted metallopeptidase